jgi:hypothetical protein
MIKKIFKILNNCPQVLSYISTTTKEFQQHQKESKYWVQDVPCVIVLDKLKDSGDDTNKGLNITSIPRSRFIPRENGR